MVRIKAGSNPNVRDTPSTDGNRIANVNSGETYELLDISSNNWYKIQLKNGDIGWFSGNMAEIYEIETNNKNYSSDIAKEITITYEQLVEYAKRA